MPLIVPGVVLGTSMYVFHVELENGLDVDVIGTFYALVAGHVVIVIPWVVRLITASLAGVDRATEEAAQNLGANAWVTFRRITLPAIRPGIVAGALFGFVTSFGNLEMSRFLVGPGRTTLPIVILQYLEWKIDPTIAAVSVVQILLIAGAMLITDRYVKLARVRSEEHTSELQSQLHLVCRLLLEKKKKEKSHATLHTKNTQHCLLS